MKLRKLKAKWNRSLIVGGTVLLMGVLSIGTLSARDLIINANPGDPPPTKALKEIIAGFEKAYPNIKVTLNLFDHESYKTSIRSWLDAQPPDVVYWYAGNRMKFFVDKGFFEDVSDLWRKNKMYASFSSTKDSMTVNGKQYGVPHTMYHWGIYYRKDIFKKYKIKIPKTFDEFIEVGEKLKRSGIVPVTIGTKYLWTAAGWFDYLNLRTHGLNFHIDLMQGEIAYTDPRVRKTFAHWKKLIDRDFFIKNHTSYSWQEAQPLLYQGKAAMYLIGNFITSHFPEKIRDKMGFFQFPIIDNKIPLAEEAPTDTAHIPSKAKNKQDARKFLSYLIKKEVQEKNNYALQQIPPHKKARILDQKDPFLKMGMTMLSQATGTSQFYDRDTPPDMAKVGMKGFQEFMVKPQNLNRILKRIEKARKRIFKK